MTVEAFSYRRYSSGKQGKGHSLARQGEPFEALCQRMEWRPNYTLDLDDKGKSAYHGHHLSKGRLGFFLAMAKKGRIKPGSVLVIENQDRLSRQEIDTARETMRELLLTGVNVYDQDDNALLSRESLNDPLALIRMILRMERAHKESARKSQFSSDNWKRKRDAIGMKKLTRTVPYWVELNHDRTAFNVIPDRVAVVRRIFDLCIAGVGIASIARKLNAEGLKTGNNCKRVGASSVQKILRNRAVLGEFTPMSGRGKNRKPSGETQPDYYPRVIDEATFLRAQTALKTRGFGKGKASKKEHNLFAGIIFNATDGNKLTYRDALLPRRPIAILLSTGAILGWANSDYRGLNYKEVESGILGQLKELDPDAIFPDNSTSHRLQLNTLDKRLKDIQIGINNVQQLINEDPSELSYIKTLRNLVDQQNRTQQAFEDLNSQIKAPEHDTLRSLQELIGKDGKFNPEGEDLRMRIRSEIRLLINEIWILRSGIRNHRWFIAQLFFKNGQYRQVMFGAGLRSVSFKIARALAPYLGDLREYRKPEGCPGLKKLEIDVNHSIEKR